MAKHIQDLIASRRAVLGALAGLPLLDLAACATPSARGAASASPAVNFTAVAASNADTVTVPPGYNWRTLVAWGDALFEGMPDRIELDALTRAEQERRFGQNNDMLALFAADYAFPPPKDQARMILCANQEYISLELTFPSVQAQRDFTAAQIEASFASVGVSVLDIERDGAGWRMVKSAANQNTQGRGHNRRITPFTPVLFTGPAARHPWIVQASQAVNAAEPARGPEPAGAVRCGTMGNCAGGLTPWGTYLTAEENFDGFFFGSASVDDQFADPAYALDVISFGYPAAPGSLREKAPRQFRIADNPRGPALYGWVVEIDPHDPTSTPKKRTALGRKKNECATTALARDGRVVLYMGDDQRDEHVYKFISRNRFDPANRAANMDLLDDGQLYCAQLTEDGAGRWIPITLAAANAAAEAEGYAARFRDEADLLVRVRDAARLLGATPMDRPEDIEAVCDDQWRGLGPVLIACTNNSDRGFAHPGNPRRESERPNTAQNNQPGHIVRFDEAGGDAAAMTFTWGVFALAGDPNTEALTARNRAGAPAHISTKVNGEKTMSGDRFACPDNMFIDSTQRVWIATDGSDAVFGDCNDGILCTPLHAEGARPVKRFLTVPVGAEACGPLMAPDERAFFCAIQHPGAADISGADYSQRRWMDDRPRPSSTFPEGGDAWPRSAVVVVTRNDGGRIGD